MTRSQEQFRRLLVILAVALPALLAPLIALPTGVAQAETCPNEQLRSENNSTTLPDCRAYELVTPPFTEASLVPLAPGSLVHGGYAAMSADGSQVVVSGLGDLGDANGAPGNNTYELTRTASGWSESNIDIPVSRFPAGEVAAYEAETGHRVYGSVPFQVTPDFGEFLYRSLQFSTEPEATEQSAAGSFWIGEADGALHRLGPAKGAFLGASKDLSHVLFVSRETGALEEDQYVPGQEKSAVPVGVNPSGQLCSALYAAPAHHAVFAYPGHESGGMSADGSMVSFYIPAGGCSPGDPAVGELFARIDESQTVAISSSSAADCGACNTSKIETSPGVFAEPNRDIDGASADGSKVFFSTTQPLLGSEQETSANIYEYDFDAPQASPADPDGRVVRVTAGKWSPGGVQAGAVIVSEDGSHVYFTASGALLGATNSQGVAPIEGQPNLYVFDTDTGTTAFIATVSPGSGEMLAPEDPTVTPNGQFLVFTTAADITPGDTSGPAAPQVFEYNAQTAELVRVSIGQDGFNDNGNTETSTAKIPGEIADNYPVAVSNDGAYVAFESPDGLTPGALNEVDGAENVYEYHDGNVYLISDGQDTSHTGDGEAAVKLRGMSPSGEDIFFEGDDRLVPQALATQKALYDAHTDGGFPAPASLLPTCTGDACQGPLSAAPTLLSPGSESQAGTTPPLIAPAPAVKPKAKAKGCKKGYVKKKNKCVKKAKAKKANTKRGAKS
jgi:hypothetical protein